MLHHPFLFGEIPTQSQATSKEFLAPLPRRKRSLLRAYRRRRGDSIIVYQVPNHKSHLLAITLFAICLSFSSPPLHQIFHFIRPLFRSPFSCRISFCLLVLSCAFYLLASSLAKNLLIWILIHLLIFSKGQIMMNQLLVS